MQRKYLLAVFVLQGVCNVVRVFQLGYVGEAVTIREEGDKEIEERVLTDLEGAFTVTRLAEQGTYSLRAHLSNGATAVVRGARSGQTVRVVVPAPLVVRGTVVYQDRRPANAATVRLVHEDTGSVQMQRVDDDGAFLFRGVMPGRRPSPDRSARGSRVARRAAAGARKRRSRRSTSVPRTATPRPDGGRTSRCAALPWSGSGPSTSGSCALTGTRRSGSSG
jgi:hypothetical protein